MTGARTAGARGVTPARLALVGAAVVLLVACSSGDAENSAGPKPPPDLDTTAPPASPSAATDQTVTIVAAGDIASTRRSAARTARIVRRVDPDRVVTMGDNAYPDGSLRDFRTKYAPNWGAFKKITRPTPGNHEYRTPRAAGYFRYFKAQVKGRKYYAWNAGAWRLYALNCEIPCGARSKQAAWLRRDAQRHPSKPKLAYLHRPRFTCSTQHRPFTALRSIWRTLDRSDGQVVLGGHNHAYERFALRRADGRRASTGMRQFVVGSGGAPSHQARRGCASRQAYDDTHRAVLRLDLEPRGYRWQLLAANGRTLDAGSATV